MRRPSLLRQSFETFIEKNKGKKLTFKEFLFAFGKDAAYAVTLVLSIPFLFFIPLPGLSNIFGIVIFLMGFCKLAHTEMWLPSFIKSKPMSTKLRDRMIKGGLILSKVLEKFTRPRLLVFIAHPVFKAINNAIIFGSGVLLALPLPPGTNFTPALSSALVSIGNLERDGIFVLMGYFVFAINMTVFVIIPVYGIIRIWMF